MSLVVNTNHPYDVKIEDLARIKMLFPENKVLKGNQKHKTGNLYSGCLVTVSSLSDKAGPIEIGPFLGEDTGKDNWGGEEAD